MWGKNGTPFFVEEIHFLIKIMQENENRDSFTLENVKKIFLTFFFHMASK